MFYSPARSLFSRGTTTGGGAFNAFTTSNRPGGLTTLIDTPCAAASEFAAWSKSAGWSTDPGAVGTGIRFLTDATNPNGSSMRHQYAAGFTAGNSPGRCELLFTNWDTLNYATIYAKIIVKHSNNWQQESSGVNKLPFVANDVSGAGAALNQTFFNLRSLTLGPDYMLQAGQPATVDGFSLGGQRKCPDYVTRSYEALTTAAYALDTWHCLEVVMVTNTGGAANGTLTLYVDNVQRTSLTNVTYSTTGRVSWRGFNIDCVWGGTGDTASAQMYLDLGGVTVAAAA